MKNFERIVELLQIYREKHGNCLVPQKYITEDGINLGLIVRDIRSGKRKTSEEEKAKLNNLGFVWNAKINLLSFEEILKLLKIYKEEYGDCLVPYKYVTKNGIKLGMLVSNIRSGIRKTSEEEKNELNNLGFVWNIKIKRISFENVLLLLSNYKEEYGDCLIPYKYVTENGINLGQIVNNIRKGSRKTSEEEKAKLNNLGFVWKV